MNYHLFVVDEESFKEHIRYGFVGTGTSKKTFNIELWEDIVRLKKNDKVIFYVKQVKKFYGVFKVASKPFFCSDAHNLPLSRISINPQKNQSIYLRYRALIGPDGVYQLGIDEFDLIDILPKKTKDILWSVIYRKLRGQRGCSPLFDFEYKTIVKKIKEINKIDNGTLLKSGPLMFENKEILKSNKSKKYIWSTKNKYDIKKDILNDNYSEHYLHAILLDNLPIKIFKNMQWVANELYSGSGMQLVDIMSLNNSIFSIIEIKKKEINKNITTQIEKYIKWLKSRLGICNKNKYQPIVLGMEIESEKKQRARMDEFKSFNKKKISLPIKYMEYFIKDKKIILNEIDYINNWSKKGRSCKL